MKQFIYESHTEWHGNNYETITKIFAVIPKAARDAIKRGQGNNKAARRIWPYP